jgi:hypothetical protein
MTMRQHFTGTLTDADHKGHIPISFDVPAGTNRLVGRFNATPLRSAGAFFDNLISLSVFAPDRSRGARHNNPVWDFEIERDYATPGYLPGPVTPGRWTVVMDTFRIIGPDPVTWTLEIDCLPDALPRPSLPAAATTAPRGPGWYRGDLHAHTLHSDGSWGVADLVARARQRGLDFMTVTDHNTPSSHAPAMALAGDDLLVMGGIELTTHYGHALTLGRRDWQEWRTGPVTGLTMPAIAQEVMDKGAVFVIAHPMAPGDPACTGCRWDFADMRPGNARIVEIWNGGPWSDYNEEGLALFREWLSAGHRLVATAGSDIHGAEGDDPLTGFNNVHAEALTEPAVLAAIAAGHNFLSSGPRLILTADEGRIPMGGDADAGVQLTVAWETLSAALTLQFIGKDGILARHDLPASGAGTVTFDDAPEGFVMAELRDPDGRLHAVTNAIFIGHRPERAQL